MTTYADWMKEAPDDAEAMTREEWADYQAELHAESASPAPERCPKCQRLVRLEPSGFCSFVCADLYEAACVDLWRID